MGVEVISMPLTNMRMKKIDCSNTIVKVKLTGYGKYVLQNHHHYKVLPKEDMYGFVNFDFTLFINLFGPFMGEGKLNVIYPDSIYIVEQDDKEMSVMTKIYMLTRFMKLLKSNV